MSVLSLFPLLFLSPLKWRQILLWFTFLKISCRYLCSNTWSLAGDNVMGSWNLYSIVSVLCTLVDSVAWLSGKGLWYMEQCRSFFDILTFFSLVMYPMVGCLDHLTSMLSHFEESPHWVLWWSHRWFLCQQCARVSISHAGKLFCPFLMSTSVNVMTMVTLITTQLSLPYFLEKCSSIHKC